MRSATVSVFRSHGTDTFRRIFPAPTCNLIIAQNGAEAIYFPARAAAGQGMFSPVRPRPASRVALVFSDLYPVEDR
jgi:hypothetical protein